MSNTTSASSDDLTLSRALALDIADIIAETPASDTRVIDIHASSTISDLFVICSGENERQLRAIQRAVLEEMAKTDRHPLRQEGDTASGWILIDFGDVVVHIFDADLRTYYDLEGRWSDAPVMLSIQ